MEFCARQCSQRQNSLHALIQLSPFEKTQQWRRGWKLADKGAVCNIIIISPSYITGGAKSDEFVASGAGPRAVGTE